jgi:hypothetical protein
MAIADVSAWDLPVKLPGWPPDWEPIPIRLAFFSGFIQCT